MKALSLLLLVACSLGACAAPGYHGPVSDHFDGKRFSNLEPSEDKSLFSAMRAFMFEERGPWVEREIAQATPLTRVSQGVRITFINHSTLLVQMDGLNILTDPIYSERASPVSWAGPARYHPPGIAFEALPPIDAVTISHNHYDHLDLATLKRLALRDGPEIIAGLGTRALLRSDGIGGGRDLDWWQTFKVGAVKIHAVPAQHWSRRGIGDTRNTLWAGFVLEGQRAKVYFAGDTAWGPHFELIRERFGPMDIALLPVGAFEPRWFMRSSHISPLEAADAAQFLGARVAIPIHWGTFALGLDGQREGVDALEHYLEVMAEPPRFERLEPGESFWWAAQSLSDDRQRALGRSSRAHAPPCPRDSPCRRQ